MDKVLNKGELIEAVMNKCNPGDFASKAAAKRAVDAVFDEMAACLGDGGTVRIDKFGTFKVSAYAARMGKNPSTHEPMEIPATQRVKFSAAGALKDAAAKAVLG